MLTTHDGQKAITKAHREHIVLRLAKNALSPILPERGTITLKAGDDGETLTSGNGLLQLQLKTGKINMSLNLIWASELGFEVTRVILNSTLVCMLIGIVSNKRF
ncbi:hypothetical protein DPMN_031761 [Dreissena polymorpha]|uniref:Uncharacterized protein n=1 Tax=Dreissena polymorpha TaxID=45954 RepID=A0A9D4M2X2_DREPO|nr:hypothetical protein DPMN_031761 [Dreissena polymorpha]